MTDWYLFFLLPAISIATLWAALRLALALRGTWRRRQIRRELQYWSSRREAQLAALARSGERK